MHEGLPESLPLGVVDEDHTVTSRNLVRNLDAFQMTDVVKTYSNVTEARKAVQQGHIYGFYLIPQGTTSEVQSQRLPTISFYTNYSYLMAGSLLYRDMRTMSELASGAASRTVLYAKGATERQAMAYLQPVVIDMHAVGNPWLNYNVYLSNVIIPGMLGLFIFMITVYGLGTELKFNTADELMQRSGGSVIVAVTGKLIPQLLVFLLSGTPLCALPLCLSALSLSLRFGPYVVHHGPFRYGLSGMGVFMFTMFPTLRLGLSFASLWGVISFSISGMSFPVMAMHPILQSIANLFPLRHYFLLYVNSALDGYPLANAGPALCWRCWLLPCSPGLVCSGLKSAHHLSL